MTSVLHAATSANMKQVLGSATRKFVYVLLNESGILIDYNSAFAGLWPPDKSFSSFTYLVQLSSLPAWEETVRELSGQAGQSSVNVELWHHSAGSGSICISWEWVTWQDPDTSQLLWAGFGMLAEEEQNFYKEMVRTVPCMLWSDDANRQPIFVNRAWTEFTGLTLPELKEHGWSYLIHPEDLPGLLETYEETFINRLPGEMEYRFRTADGNYRWVIDMAVPQYDASGLFIGYAGSITDIHESKLRTEALHYQATIFNNVTDMVVTSDMDSFVTSWNRRAEEFYGLSAEMAIGRHITDLVKIEYLDLSREEAHEIVCREGKWKGEVKYVDFEGNTFYILNRLTYLVNEKGERIGHLAIGTDITEKKLAQQKVEESEFFFRNLIRHSIDAIFLTDKEGRMIYGSPSVTEILGYESEDFLNRSIFEYILPEDYQKGLQAFSDNYSGTVNNEHLVIRIRKKDGEYLWCMVRGHRLPDNSLNADMALYVFDYTSRKQGETALKESEQRFKNMTRDLTLGVVCQDSRSQLIFANQTALSYLGLSTEQLAGDEPFDPQWNIIGEDGQNLRARDFPAIRAIRTLQPIRDLVIGVFIPSRKERNWLLANTEPVFDQDGQLMHVITSYTDITVRKRLEQRLIEQEVQRQKQITRATIDGQERERRELGVLLHENFSQRLTSLKLYLDILADTSTAGSRDMVQLAKENVQSLLDEMRTLSHALTPATLGDLGLLDSLEDLFERTAPKMGFKVHFNHEEFQSNHLKEGMELMLFRIVEEQLNNIGTGSGSKNAYVNLSADRRQAVLEITDDGAGFERQEIANGHGFQTIQNRVHLLNGEVEIYSLPGQGCSLKAIFPLE